MSVAAANGVAPACFADVNGQVYLRGQVTWSPAGGPTVFPVRLGALPSDGNGVCVCSPEMSKVVVTTTGLVYPRPFKPTMCTVRLQIEGAGSGGTVCGSVEIVGVSCGSLQSVPTVPSYEVAIDSLVYFSDNGLQGASARKRKRRERETRRAEVERRMEELEAELAAEERKAAELDKVVERLGTTAGRQGRRQGEGGVEWREIAVSSLVLVCISALITVAARRTN
jgi:hypothetical protein